jgi:diadenosine tetraphosphate (Ap4A) HIT family hydrolase
MSHCHICTMLGAAAPEDVVSNGDQWSVVGLRDVPGMLMAFTNRHDSGVGSIPDSAAAELGPLVRALSAGLVASGDFERASVIYLGDNAVHTHFMVVGRPPGDSVILDNAPLLARFAHADRDRARAIVADVRAALST